MSVEFIFGLTGATASVLIAYILPSLIFIRLLDNSSPSVSVESPSPHHSGRPQLQSTSSSVWAWRRRLAVCLLIFGIISGITCTDAILSAVREEAVVVKIAQKLAEEGAVIAQTSRTQQLAKEAVVTVSAVTAAGKQLGAAQANASGTLGKLQEAAQQLEAIAGSESNSSSASHGDASKGGGILGGIGDMIKEHKAQQQETKVLRNVTSVITSVIDEISSTYQSVQRVIVHLDDAVAKLKIEASKQANDTAAAAAKASSGSDKVSTLAAELGKALGGYSIDQSTFASSSSGLKALEQLRSNAKATLSALNQTLGVLQGVAKAVSKAKDDPHHSGSSQIKDVATQAMRVALNATATSALAMNLTRQALQKSAHKETEELISVLNRVTSDLQKAQGSRAKAASGSPPPPPPPHVDGAANSSTIITSPVQGQGQGQGQGNSSSTKASNLTTATPPAAAAKADGGAKGSKGEELKKAIDSLTAVTVDSGQKKQDKLLPPATSVVSSPPFPPAAPEDSIGEELNEKELDAAQVAIDEAASLTRTDKEEAIKKIGDSLGQIGNTKVQERVTELVKELKDTKDAGSKSANEEEVSIMQDREILEMTDGLLSQVVSMAVTSDSSAASLLKEKEVQPSGEEPVVNVTEVVEKSLETLDGKDMEKSQGPIVVVAADGKLMQQEEEAKGQEKKEGGEQKSSSGLARKLGLGN